MATILNYSALRAYAYTSGNESVFVQGYSSIGDGGQGLFYWNPSNTDSDNDGTTIKVTTVTTGRWKRIYSGSLNIQWFGAKGDGVFDNTSAVTNASGTGTPILFTGGIFNFNANISIPVPVFMDSSSIIKSSHNIIFNGFDAPLKKCLDVSGNVIFRYIEKIYPQWYGAMGNAKAVNGSINSSSNLFHVANVSLNNFVIGDSIYVFGAGSGGSILSANVTAVSGDKLTITLNTNALTTVNDMVAVSADDTIALQRFFNCSKVNSNIFVDYTQSLSTLGCSKLYMPRGAYASFDTINYYTGSVLEGEKGNVLEGAVMLHCNIAKPLINAISLNFDLNNNCVNAGNGDFNFKEIVFKGINVNDNLENAPIIKFQNPWNINSDTEFDHCFFQNGASSYIELGTVLSGTGTSGSHTLTVDNGSVIRSYGIIAGSSGNQIIIKGAGAGGTDLSTFVTAGGFNIETNTISNVFTLNDPILTSVTNTQVFPLFDQHSIKLNDCEFDAGRRGIKLTGNAQGQLLINHMEAYLNIRAFLLVDSINQTGFDIFISDSQIIGGNPLNPEPTYRYAFYYDGRKIPSNANHCLVLDNVTLKKTISSGVICNGGLTLSNLNTLQINNCRFEDIDNGADVFKILATTSIKKLSINNNLFLISNLNEPSNARMIELATQQQNITCYHISGNILENTSGHDITFIYSDYVLNSQTAVLIANSYIGLGNHAFQVNETILTT